MQHLGINIYRNTHTHVPICIYHSLSQAWADNICLPELREWVGVKAMTAGMFLDMNLLYGKTEFSLFKKKKKEKKKHTKGIYFNAFLQSECMNTWGIELEPKLRCAAVWVSELLQLCPATAYLPHKPSSAQICWRWGPPMSYGYRRPIVSIQLLTITHKSVKIHEHFLNTIVGTQVQLSSYFAPWQIVLIFKAWKIRIFLWPHCSSLLLWPWCLWKGQSITYCTCC